MAAFSVYVGLDPGVRGGVAVIREGGPDVVTLDAYRMPDSRHGVRELLKSITFQIGDIRAALERVHSSPQMGVTSAFSFGTAYERLGMALTCFGIQTVEVTPQRWQRVLGCRSGGDKNVTKAAAQRVVDRIQSQTKGPSPLVRVTHATADAILLAEYCRLVHA